MIQNIEFVGKLCPDNPSLRGPHESKRQMKLNAFIHGSWETATELAFRDRPQPWSSRGRPKRWSSSRTDAFLSCGRIETPGRNGAPATVPFDFGARSVKTA